MNILSVIYRSLLTVLLAGSVMSSDTTEEWIVKGDIDLSSTFCDFRPLHFHGGIDIRTNQRVGRELFSPVDGYVYRIKYAYLGYGKGIYLKDKNENIYVIGHMSRLSDKLEEVVHKIQYSAKRYGLDRIFKPGEITLKKGELFGYSGQSGYGPPHIHFEKRTPANEPVNPLTNGFSVADNIKPEFEAVGFVYVDSSSLFDNGKRRKYNKPSYDPSTGRYYLDEVVCIRGAFGVMIDINDRIRPGGPKLNIKRAKLYIDDFLYYEVDYEKYNYNQTIMVDLSYDYYEATKNKSYWHVLYNPPGKNFNGAKAKLEKGGIFEGQSVESYGLHSGRIEIFDAAGYKRELDFEFYYAPAGKMYEIVPVSTSMFYLRGQSDNRYVDIEDITILNSRDYKKWNRLHDNMIKNIGESYEVDLTGIDNRIKFLRIRVNGRSGWREIDQYYILDHYKSYDYSFDYKFVGGGILFNISALNKYAPNPYVKIIYDDGYEKTIEAEAYSHNKFSAFYRNTKIKSQIVRFEIIDSRSNKQVEGLNVTAVAVGTNLDASILSYGDKFAVAYKSGSFYSPAIIEIKPGKGIFPYPRNIIGKAYSIEPKTMPLADDLSLSFNIDSTVDKSKIGVYRLNSKNEWKWLNSEIKTDHITARSSLTGIFAVLKDNGAPKIQKVYPPNGKTVFSPWPQIRCVLTDGLAQIKDDTQVEVFLNGKWLIPEYDPETFVLKTYPDKSLKKGRYELTIRATDRVGNRREVKTHFFVNDKKKK